MKRMKNIIASLMAFVLLLTTAFTVPASAWNASPSTEVDMSLKLVGIMNMKIFQQSPYITNVTTTTTGDISGKTLYCYKFSGTGTSIGKNWPHQMGDGPYTEAQFEEYFGVDAVTECMTANEEEVAVYMLYDLGDPNSTEVQKNMKLLGITDINEWYKLMAKKAKIRIDALPGGGTAHECAITSYYRYSDDWRSFATANSGKYVNRSTLESMGIAAPNENRYFFETKDSQKMIDGGNAFPGVYDESVAQYIDEKQSYSLPVWEDTDENASWNIINPVPTCNIYSRWYDDFSAESTYDYFYNIKNKVVAEKYGDNYTPGQWYGYTQDTELYSGLTVDNGIVPKNWEWNTVPYNSGKSNGVYSSTTASKSHLGYGEYCPARVTSSHWFNLPENTANDDAPGRFLTVMVRETGTMCGLDGCGHWHSVQVNGMSTTNVIKFEPEINDDSVVIDYGLSVQIPLDANDWVWTTDPTNAAALPNISDVRISAGDPDDDTSFTSSAVKGKYGTLEIDNWSNQWGHGNCVVRYTPKKFVNEPDVFYYKLYPGESDLYKPMIGKISVIPATLVYYEDSFSANDNNDDSGFDSSLIYSGNWSYVDANGNATTGTAVNGSQTNDNDHYGYDDYYKNNQGFSDNSAHQGKRGDSLTFTFKGTGCDVIMRTDAMDGSVRYSVTKSSINQDGTSGGEDVEVTPIHVVSCRNNNGQTLYQLPVVSLRYDDYAFYTVQIDAVTSRNIYIDGIRLYNPLGVYGENGADNATMDEFYEIAEKNAITSPVYNIVYDSSENADGDIGFLGVYNNWNEWYGNEKDEDGNPADFSTLLSIGPNNEVYLAPGQSMVFNVTNSELADLLFAVEAKALSGSGTMSISVEGNSVSETATVINSNTAMYYDYDISASSAGSQAKIRIENSGSNLISVSNLKYSKVLTTNGKIDYTFIDSDGLPVSGVKVTVRDSAGNTVKTALTDENGKFECTDLPLGKYKAYIEVPENTSTVPTRTVEVSEYVFGETKQFVLHYVNTTIGSHPSIYLSPSVTLSKTTASFENFRTETDSGSYVITYTFDGVKGSNGYISDNNRLTGTLTVVVNSDGSASYKFDGSGKTNGKSFSSSTGSTTAVSFSNEKISIDYVELLKTVTGYSDNNFKFTDITALILNNTDFEITAYELANASIVGNYGPAATVTVGEDPHYTTDKTATVTYSFKDENGNPVSGATATIDSTTLTSDSTGTVTFADVPFGSQIATFTTPAGLSTPAADSFYTDPTCDQYSKEFTLLPFDLTIGSASETLNPNVQVTASEIVFTDLLPFTAPGSYKMEYVFTGTTGTNGFVDKNTYLQGTLTLIVNADGTVSFAFTGSGKTNRQSFSNTSGTITATVDSSFSSVTIPFDDLMKGVTKQTGKNMLFSDATTIINNYADFTVTSYENADATGTAGETMPLIVNAAANDTAEVSFFSFVKNIRDGLDEMITDLTDRINASISENEALKAIDEFLEGLGNRTEDEEESIMQGVTERVVKFFDTVTEYLKAIFNF